MSVSHIGWLSTQSALSPWLTSARPLLFQPTFKTHCPPAYPHAQTSYDHNGLTLKNLLPPYPNPNPHLSNSETFCPHRCSGQRRLMHKLQQLYPLHIPVCPSLITPAAGPDTTSCLCKTASLLHPSASKPVPHMMARVIFPCLSPPWPPISDPHPTGPITS